MSSIFKKIADGEIPAHKVAESNDYLAFMDIEPLKEGHVLVIPKKETDYVFDMEDSEYIGLWVFAKIVAAGIKKAFPCRKVGLAVVGLEVPHTHIHLIPINAVSEMSFEQPKLKLTDEQLTEHAERIRAMLAEVTRNGDA